MDQPLDYVVYVLWSERHRKRYVGMTSNLIGRFRSHNSLGKKGWTVKFRPWHVVHVEFYMSKGSALARENFLKTGKGRDWMALNLNMGCCLICKGSSQCHFPFFLVLKNGTKILSRISVGMPVPLSVIRNCAFPLWPRLAEIIIFGYETEADNPVR